MKGQRLSTIAGTRASSVKLALEVDGRGHHGPAAVTRNVVA